MSILAQVLVALIAALHLYIMWFEMFAWESRGPKVFSALPADLFTPTKKMAANQGLYNGFLAAGLLWSLFINDDGWQSAVAVFFLLFIAIAGIYGAATVARRTAYFQTVPAAIALLVIAVF